MNKIAWCGSLAFAVLAAACAAQATDLKGAVASKTPPTGVPLSWTGFYAGLGLGFRASRDDVTTTLVLADGVSTDLSNSVVAQPFDGIAFRASPYGGFNWQFAPRWVTGIEGTFGLANQSSRLGGFVSSPFFGSTTFEADGLAVKTTWDAGLRGKIGYLLTPATLAYASGGIAWQHFVVTSNCLSLICSGNGQQPPIVTNSATKLGWTIGGGIETALWGPWLARAEYHYADFGIAPLTITRTATAGPALTVDNFSLKLRTHTAMFGLAYRFGDPIFSDTGAAFAATPAPAAGRWNGFYAGLGGGVRVARADLTEVSESAGGVDFDMTGAVAARPFDSPVLRGSSFVGFNWQFAPRWVTGIEGDFGFADQKTTRDGFTTIAFADSQEPGESMSIRTTWDASLRGRLGFLVTPATLAYLTGGAAWQRYEVTLTCASDVCSNFFGNVTPAIVTSSAIKPGWTLGGGLEIALWGHWLARGEYRYADFAASSFTATLSSTNPSFNPTVANFDVKMRTHSATFGLAYQFN